MARKNKKTEDQKYALAEETNKRLGLISTILARNSARVKQLQDESKGTKTSVSSKKTMLTLTTSLSIIASTLKRLNNTLSSLKSIKPVTPGIIPIAAPSPAATAPEKEKEKDKFGDLFKSLFTNPAVIAAVAGITYLFLPKEIKEKLGAFFKGFTDGITETIGDEENGLKKLGTTTKIAGVAIATIFGIKMLGSIAEAILTTTKLIRMMGVKGKTAKKLALAGAALAGGAAYVAVDALAGEADQDSTSYNLDAAPDSVKKKYNQSQMGEDGERQAPAATTPYPKSKKPAGATNSAVEAIEFFTKKGWTYEQAAGIVGNLQVESGSNLDHTAYNKKEKAYGIAQWRGVRKKQFEKNYGKPIEESTFREQLEFVNWELNTDKVYRSAGAKLKEATTAAEAAAIVDRLYEQSSGEHIQQRVMNAEELSKPMKQANASSATSAPATPTNNIGQNINNVSTEVKRASQRPRTQTQVANIDNSKQKETGKENPIPLPVPSPVANRGSLLNFTKHSTAYV